MKKISQFGRTMLETISVMAIIGVLGVTGIYIYVQGMNSARADAMIKEILTLSAQQKSNLELTKMGSKKKIFVPELGGRAHVDDPSVPARPHNGNFEVAGSISNVVAIKFNSNEDISPALLNALKSKAISYGSNATSHIAGILTKLPKNGDGDIKAKSLINLDDNSDNILKKDSSEKLEDLYFVIKFDVKDTIPEAKKVFRTKPASDEENCKNTGGNWYDEQCRFCGAHASWVPDPTNACLCDSSTGWFDFGQGFCEQCPAGYVCSE